MRTVLISENNERQVIFNKNEKRILKNLGEVRGFQQHIANDDTYHFLVLIKHGLISNYCTLTEKGIAYSVATGAVSFSAFLRKFSGMKDHYTALVYNSKDEKELDVKAREFFRKQLSQL